MQADLLDVLTRLASASNIRCMRVTPPFDGLDQFDYGLRKALDPYFDWQEFGSLLLQSTPPNTLLFAEGTFELQFALFRIPDEENAVFMIGPWTAGPRSESSRRWAQKYLGKAGDEAVQEYYNGVKLLQANDFYMTIRVLVGMMIGEDLVVKELKEFLPFCFHPDVRYFNEPEFQKEIPVAMLEQRYESENRILEAVSRGDDEAAIEAMHQHSRFTYGGRFEGSLYQQKNRMIVFNTLLRKAIEPVKDEVVTYNGSVIDAVWSASAGYNTQTGTYGTCSGQDAWGSDVPYLQSVESPYEEQYHNLLRRSIGKDYTYVEYNDSRTGEPYTDADTTHKSLGGYVQYNTFVSNGRSYRYIGQFVSSRYCFDFGTDENGTPCMTYYGFGHGVGMSQCGAVGYAAERNMGYKAILRHYYKGASITSQGSSGGLFGWLRSLFG